MAADPQKGITFEALGLVETFHLFGGISAPAACQVVLAVRVPGAPEGVVRYRTTIFKDAQLAELALHATRHALLGRRLLLKGVPITGITDYQLTEVVHGSLEVVDESFQNQSWLTFAAQGKVDSWSIAGPKMAPISAQIRLTCRAPGLPGGQVHVRTLLMRNAQLEFATRLAKQGTAIGTLLTLRGIPIGSQIEADTSVEVLAPILEPAAEFSLTEK